MTSRNPSRRQAPRVHGRRPLRSSDFLIVASLLGTYLTGCGGGSTEIAGPEAGPGAPAADGSIAEVVVTPSDTEMGIDSSLEFSATVLDSEGAELTRTVEWQSTDTGVARVSDGGRTRGRAMGTAEIVAAVEGVRDTAHLRIGRTISSEGGSVSDPDSVVTLEIPEGAVSEDMIVTVEESAPSDGNGGGVIPGTPHDLLPDGLQFSTPVTLTIRYDPDGISDDVNEDRITAYRLDSATPEAITTTSVDTANNLVTARIDHFSRYAVGFPVEVASVTVSPDSVTLGPGASTQLEAQVRDSDGSEFDRTVAWSSSDAAVATVDEDGTVSAQAEGETTITASIGGESDSAAVAVAPVPVTSIQVSPDATEMLPGDSVQLSATLRDADGNEVDRTVAWSSSDAAVATVDEDGTVSAQADGEATITASSGGESDSTAVTVTPRARRVTLGWSAPLEDQEGGDLDDLAGYRVYYSASSPVDKSSATVVEVGDTTRVTVEGLDPDIYHFAVSAVDTAGNESPLSDEVTADAR